MGVIAIDLAPTIPYAETRGPPRPTSIPTVWPDIYPLTGPMGTMMPPWAASYRPVVPETTPAPSLRSSSEPVPTRPARLPAHISTENVPYIPPSPAPPYGPPLPPPTSRTSVVQHGRSPPSHSRPYGPTHSSTPMLYGMEASSRGPQGPPAPTRKPYRPEQTLPVSPPAPSPAVTYPYQPLSWMLMSVMSMTPTYTFPGSIFPISPSPQTVSLSPQSTAHVGPGRPYCTTTSQLGCSTLVQFSGGRAISLISVI